MKKLGILPLLVVVAALSFGVRFGEFVTGVSQGTGAAMAEEAIPSEEAASATDESASLEKESSTPSEGAADPISPSTSEVQPVVEGAEITQEQVSDTGGIGDAPAVTSQGTPVNWRDSTESDMEFSEIKLELFNDLQVKQKALEDMQREMSVREALLKTAEQELEQKYTELLSLKAEIEELLKQQSTEEQNRIASLVKIYEGMKPKDAARIFNTLDMDILLSVVGQMSERKSAPILAAMDPDRARALTAMLMEQKALNNVETAVQ